MLQCSSDLIDMGGQRLSTAVVHAVSEREKATVERERIIVSLQAAQADLRTMSGLVTICAWCKKVRDDEGFWSQVDVYVSDRTHAHFSHGICPDCQTKLESEDIGH